MNPSRDRSPPTPVQESVRWPHGGRHRREILVNMERYLEAEGHVRRIVSYQTAERGFEQAPSDLPAALASVIGLCERTGPTPRDPDLELGVAGEIAEELWHRLCSRAGELAHMSSAPAAWEDPSRLEPWELMKLVAVAIATGSRYARVWVPEIAEAEPGSWSTRLEASQLLLTSALQFLRNDTRRLAWLVRQPFTRSGLTGVCRHYTAAVQALFFAAKRSQSLHRHVFVLAVGGKAHPRHGFGHAWNWYVDSRVGQIVAFDLTGADWLVDRGRADSILNRGFDGSLWSNVSCFLATLFRGYENEGSPLYGSEHVRHAVAALVDPSSVRGQALLFHLAHQPIHEQVRGRIADYLAARGFNRLFLGWRAELAATSWLDRLTRRAVSSVDPAPQLALLAAIGI